MKWWRTLCATVAVSASTVGCRIASTEPEALDTPTVQFQVSAAEDSSVAVALSRVLHVRVELSRSGDTVEATVPVEVHDRRVVARLRAAPPNGTGPIAVRAELLALSAVMFVGEGAFQSGGSPGTAQIALRPVAGRIESSIPNRMRSIGEAFQLVGNVEFATGDPWFGVSPTWVSENPAVVAIVGDSAVARTNGFAVLTASYQHVSKFFGVDVVQVPVSFLALAPADTTVGVGAQFPLRAIGVDARGAPLLEGAELAWSVSGPVSIVSGGYVRANALGTAMVSATAAGVTHTVRVNVQ